MVKKISQTAAKDISELLNTISVAKIMLNSAAADLEAGGTIVNYIEDSKIWQASHDEAADILLDEYGITTTKFGA